MLKFLFLLARLMLSAINAKIDMISKTLLNLRKISVIICPLWKCVKTPSPIKFAGLNITGATKTPAQISRPTKKVVSYLFLSNFKIKSPFGKLKN